MLVTFIQQLINGLMLGGSYALVAIGYTLIFGVLNLLHLAHGEVAMVGSRWYSPPCPSLACCPSGWCCLAP